MEIYNLILSLRNGTEAEQENAISNLPKIAAALGKKRTAEELFSYILETPSFSEKSWIEIIIQTTKLELCNYGKMELKRILLVISQIAKFESNQIRNEVINCLDLISHTLSNDQIQTIFLPIVFSMSENKVFPTIRACAIQLFGKVLDIIDDDSFDELVSILKEMSIDRSSLVRKEACILSSKILQRATAEQRSVLLDTMLDFSNDSIFIVAREVPNFLVQYAKYDDKLSDGVYSNLATYPNWQVRSNFFNHLNEIFAPKTSPRTVLNCISKGIIDTDSDVCASATGQLGFYITMPGADIKEAQSKMEAVLADDRKEVISAAIKSLSAFASVDANFVSESLASLVLHSEDGGISAEALETLRYVDIPEETRIGCLAKATEYEDWREREPIVRILKKMITKPSESATDLVKKMLFDDACAIRSATIDELPELLKIFGEEWTKGEFLNIIEENISSNDYQIRQTAALALIDSELYNEPKGKEILLKLISDNVCNVRYIIAKRLPRESPFLDELKNDEDPDVREACE